MRARIAGAVVIALLLAVSTAGAEDTAAIKARIYPRLKDRRCSNMTLDKCSCVDSREMKAYIDALIDAGLKDDEILYHAGKRFSPGAIVDEGTRTAVEKRLIGELGDNRPLMVIDPLTYDFGKVSKQQGKVSCFFAVRNAGTAPLVVTGIKVSCKCASASLTLDKKKGPAMGSQGPKPSGGVSIDPGKSAELEVVFDLADRAMPRGAVFRNVTITSNDSLYPEITIPVRATIEK